MKRIGICGTGTMGATMAQIFAEQGYETLLWGRTESSLERGRQILTIGESQCLKLTTQLEDLSDCDIIIESIAEHLETKQDFFEKLSHMVRPDTILATNTSGLSMNRICERVQGRERFLGMHWFNPSNMIPLIEIICNDKTYPIRQNRQLQTVHKPHIGSPNHISSPHPHLQPMPHHFPQWTYTLLK